MMKTTKDVIIPKNPLEMVIGQAEAVRLAKVVAKQHRNLFLVGPPGIGKSMLARAIASILEPPKTEISVLHNPDKAERPIIELRSKQQITSEKKKVKIPGNLLDPRNVPFFVSERLGFRCRRCGVMSSPESWICPECGADKFKVRSTPFDDLFSTDVKPRESRVHTTKISSAGKEEHVVFERDKDKVRVFDQKELKEYDKQNDEKPRKIIVSLDRTTFVQATGASETELLGDIAHDPYGTHPEIGSPPYSRVIAGAVHEAHEGVLFVDELATLGELQRYILTSMQDKRFPIVGRNPTSSGASVKVADVPCDFILVAAVNIQDLGGILSPLRSRIIGNGYELLMNTHMEVNEQNKQKLIQFVAQEIVKDNRIPHMDMEGVEEIINEAKNKARKIDDVNGYTLRMRNLASVIKTAGDLAVTDKVDLITVDYVKKAITQTKSIEEQLKERYGSWYRASMSDRGQGTGNQPGIA